MTSHEEESAGVKIRRATVRDFARIKWAEMKPDRAVVVIGGKNAQGKSSFINALIAGIGGKTFLPEKPVRVGAERSETVIELGTEETTEFTIRQFYTAEGRYGLEVKSRDGFVHPKGQTFLDSFYSKLSFDPLGFVRAKPKEQVDIMNKALGLDFSKLDFDRKQAYDERTIVNREVSSLEKQLQAKEHFPDAPAEPVSVSELTAQLEAALTKNRELEGAAGAISAKRAAADRLEAEAKRLNDEAAALRKRADELEATAQKALEDVTAIRAEATAAEDQLSEAKPIDVEPIRVAIRDADETNRRVAENKQVAELKKRLAASKKKSDDLSKAIGRVDSEKEKAIRNAKFPVEGVQLTEEGILLNGLPFEQASSAEQLRVSLNVAFRLRSELKVHFSKEGGLFDSESLAILEEEASRAGVQVILEMPTRTPADEDFASIIIEDGYVRGAGEAPDADNFLALELGGEGE
ncbi:chromosome segregation protein [Caudoviricetes sp.]|nr:chromosome segregation protein [Caudoviricetes sp.]